MADGDVYNILNNGSLYNDNMTSYETSSNGTNAEPSVQDDDEAPFVFNDCVMDTLFIYTPCFFVLLSAPAHAYYLTRDPLRRSIEHSFLNVIKTVSCSVRIQIHMFATSSLLVTLFVRLFCRNFRLGIDMLAFSCTSQYM